MAKRYKIVLIFFLAALSFTTCITLKEYDISGVYKINPLGESFSYSEFLQLCNNGTFSITSTNANYSFLDYIIRCDTTKGTWQRHEKSIILTTDCKSVDAKDNVLQISPIEFSDSIKLKVVNFSDGSPAEMFFSYFDETDNLIEKTTNKDGIIMLPDRMIPFYNHVGSGECLSLEGGYYYQVTFFDCFPIETYVRDTFLIRNDKLVKKQMNIYSGKKLSSITQNTVRPKTYTRLIMDRSLYGDAVEQFNTSGGAQHRNTTDFGYDNVTTSFDRGFTGHEHLYNFGLINMNGTVYNTVPSTFPTCWITRIDELGLNNNQYCKKL